jgi:hypothetical protein
VFLAKDETGSGRGQLFYLPYPNGVIGKITNGVEIYEGLNVSNDSRRLATVLEERNSTIWIASGGDAGRMRLMAAGYCIVLRRVASQARVRIPLPSTSPDH